MHEQSTNSIEVHELRKSYSRDGTYAVDNVSFGAGRGEFVTLLGPSGCGKTTTLRCVAGLEQPDSGQIMMGGRVVFDASNGRNVRTEDRPIGMVPQSYGIWPHMTVFDNAAFPLRHGRNRKGQRDVRQRVLAMLEQVGLATMADRWATQLSGGQQQRLALARALLGEPEVLLLDEPLSNLDAKLRNKLRQEIRSFQKQFGVTTLYVTHDQSEALALSDTVIVMNVGVIEQIDPPDVLYNKPKSAFVADFIGSANLLPVRDASTQDSGILAKTESGSFLCASPGQVAAPASPGGGYVCIRPESVEVRAGGSDKAVLAAHNEVAGTVVTAEFLGNRTELVVDVHGTQFTASIPPGPVFRLGDEVVLQVDPSAARYLDR